jgi:dCTP deaminase
MVLADSEILKGMDCGDLTIDPFNIEHLNPNSVDLTLHPDFKVYDTVVHTVTDMAHLPKDIFEQKLYTYNMVGDRDVWLYHDPLDVKKDNPVLEFKIPDYGYILSPGQVYLYACNERIGTHPKAGLRAKVEGKSSLGRLGLFIHVTAGFIDTGFAGSLVLELVATRPIRVYPDMKICQLEFTKVFGEVLEPYGAKKGSKYMNQKGVQQSRMHENWANHFAKPDPRNTGL